MPRRDTDSAPVVSCPVCGKAVVWKSESRFRPFCSERCKLIDLGQWANERHRIPGEAVPDEGSETPDSDVR
ncbi:MAG: DNA gyrase inhibitor YacG [Pseudomonadota bacterium]